MKLRYLRRTIYLGDFIIGEANEYETVLQFKNELDKWEDVKTVKESEL